MALKQILVLDSEPGDMRAVEGAVAGMNLDVVQAQSGQEALRLLSQREFCLLLLDADTLGGDVQALAELLLGNGKADGLPIILLAGTPAEEHVQHLENAAVDVLPKPLDGAVLRGKLRLYCMLQEQKTAVRAQRTQLERERLLAAESSAERRQAEEILRESEARYRTLVELSPVAIAVQAGQEIVYVNSSMLHLLGVGAREDMLGQSLLNFFNPDTRLAGEKFLKRTLRQGGRLPPVEASFLRSDGAMVHVEMAGASIMYGGQVGAQFALLDITNRKHIEDELRSLTRKDELTQVGNRRAFDEALDSELRRAQRAKHPIALLMIDIDAFKPYNDNFGHRAGDTALQRVAAALQHAVQRPGDHVARYGGEEFAVILPETSFHGARKVAEDIRTAVQNLEIPHAYSPVAPVITVSSGGVHASADRPLMPNQLVEAADYCLYQAKDAGRNRVKLKRV